MANDGRAGLTDLKPMDIRPGDLAMVERVNPKGSPGRWMIMRLCLVIERTPKYPMFIDVYIPETSEFVAVHQSRMFPLNEKRLACTR